MFSWQTLNELQDIFFLKLPIWLFWFPHVCLTSVTRWQDFSSFLRPLYCSQCSSLLWGLVSPQVYLRACFTSSLPHAHAQVMLFLHKCLYNVCNGSYSFCLIKDLTCLFTNSLERQHDREWRDKQRALPSHDSLLKWLQEPQLSQIEAWSLICSSHVVARMQALGPSATFPGDIRASLIGSTAGRIWTNFPVLSAEHFEITLANE